MSRVVTIGKEKRSRAATASYTVRFRNKPRRPTQPHQGETTGRVPRVTRLLALAHKIDRMIWAGEIHDWSEAARIVGVTRARMTQISNLLLLAPDIQEIILEALSFLEGRDPVTERHLRLLTSNVIWKQQHQFLQEDQA